MRRLFLFLIGCLAGCNDEPAGTGATPAGRANATTRPALLAELESLPTGLRVTHTPAEIGDPTGPNTNAGDWKYRWIFKTEVSAIDRPLTVTQFGILAWDGHHWILPPDQRRYNSGVLDQRTFAEWYACPGALIAPGKPATDPQNWAGSHELADFQQKWFFVGTDAEGKRDKGEAVVRLIAGGK